MLDEEWPSTIIFLDVDGVLNSQASRESMGNDLPSAKCLAHLAHLVNETDSALVLSSTWRFEADDVVVLEDALQQIGIGPIFGATPYWGAVDVASRGAEIQRWLQDSAPASVVAWLALDDMDLPGWCPTAVDAEHFQLTQDAIGLTGANVDEAIVKLRRQQLLLPKPSEWLPVHERMSLEATLAEAIGWAIRLRHDDDHNESLASRVARYLVGKAERTPVPPAPKKPRAPLLNGDRQAHKEAVAQLSTRLSEALNYASRCRAAEPLRAIAARLLYVDTPLSSGALIDGPTIQVDGTTVTVWARGTAVGAMRVHCWRLPESDDDPSPNAGSSDLLGLHSPRDATPAAHPWPLCERRSYSKHCGWCAAPAYTAATALCAADNFEGKCVLHGLQPASRYEVVVETAADDAAERCGAFCTPPKPARHASGGATAPV